MNFIITSKQFDELHTKLKLMRIHIENIEKRVKIIEASLFGEAPQPLLAEVETSLETVTKKREKKDSIIISNTKLLNTCSKEELIQILWKLGIAGASKQMHRDEIIENVIELVTGDLSVPHSNEDPLDNIRAVIYEFISNAQVDTSNMTCSLHCPTCPHYTVIECWNDNKDTLKTEREKTDDDDRRY